MTSTNKIPVTKPNLPELDKLMPYLEDIWASKCLTNNGPYHQRLEANLCQYLGVSNLSLVSNGTLGLVVALKTLNVTGEVITTPYSFVATSHALYWNNLKPVFVDIDPDTLNLDASKIEAAITPHTSAILPVHCYGNPCDFEHIQRIADKHGLKVIYDAAHAFGVELKENNLLAQGDVSVLSFHATKAFNTLEGGAIICREESTKKEVDYSKNFGFESETMVVSAGINAKMNEICAAIGLLQIDEFAAAREKRGMIDSTYRSLLDIEGIRCFEYESSVKTPNYTYFPIFVEDGFGISRDEVYELLREHDVLARRYFYPLISGFPMYRDLESSSHENLRNAEDVAKKILCLPIFPDLQHEDLVRIVDILKKVA